MHHLDVLERAADALGYSGLDVDAAADAITGSDAPTSLVALIPTPADHRAASPGTEWKLVTGPFAVPDASMPLRARTSRHRRNHLSPTINALILGDAELRAGTREAGTAGYDEVVWLNLADAVSCVGAGALFAEIGGRIVTPAVVDGVPDSAWRVAAIGHGGAVEQRIELDDLRSASSVACLWPWGSVQAVGAIDDTTYADRSLAPRVAEAVAIAARGA